MSFWLLWQENTYLYVELALDPKDYSVYRGTFLKNYVCSTVSCQC